MFLFNNFRWRTADEDSIFYSSNFGLKAVRSFQGHRNAKGGRRFGKSGEPFRPEKDRYIDIHQTRRILSIDT
jgi:hypothetical protein